jgi:hypothetical protein
MGSGEVDLEPGRGEETQGEHERRARAWDRWVTGAIVVFLFLPFPIARFDSLPGGEVVLDRLVMPWSRFRICYVSFQDGTPVEEEYTFTWPGRLDQHHGPFPADFALDSAEPSVLKWQDAPEMALGNLFINGESLRLRTLWRPLLLWPIEKLWRIR